jgi:cell division inhibitor SepF
MAKFLDSMRNYLFAEGEEEQDALFGEEEEFEAAQEPQAEVEEPVAPRRNKIVNMSKTPTFSAVSGAGSMKMILFQPLSYEDSQAIVDNLRANKPVIVNMVDLERECAQRVLDFMAGAVYALNGTIRRVSFGIFVIVPSNVSIVGNGEEEENKEKDLLR